MQTQVITGESTQMSPLSRSGFANEFSHADQQASVSKAARPRILQRRAARWARRDR